MDRWTDRQTQSNVQLLYIIPRHYRVAEYKKGIIQRVILAPDETSIQIHICIYFSYFSMKMNVVMMYLYQFHENQLTD